jgi:S1-C subfamily serine protease
MKTVGTLIAAAFLLMPWCAMQGLAQDSNGKKIVITKRSVDAEGSEVTETIVKRGKSAENFDVDQYVRENRSENTQVEVVVETEDSESKISTWDSRGNNFAWSSANCADQDAFLGVEEDSDEDEDKPGVVVEVVRGSAAEKAGLRNNDLIISLDDTKLTRWSDLSRAINAKKPGDKLRIAYERNGNAASTEATLTRRQDVQCNDQPKQGFLGVSDEDDDEDAPGVAVSITRNSGAEKAGLKDGDVILALDDTPIADFEDISDFMDYTKPGDVVKVAYERDGQRSTTEATLGEQKSWDWDQWSKDWSQTWNDNFSINVREKEACLGVYSDSSEREGKRGTAINGFTSESAAREANLENGDLILAINGQRIQNHDELWSEIAKYKPNDKVQVEYLRDDKTRSVEVSLKACRDQSSIVEILDTDESGDNKKREFFTWNWGNDERKSMMERRVITIRKGEGDARTNETPPADVVTPDRKLKLQVFKAFPNPTPGQLTIEFKGEAVATTLSIYDAAGRQLFREEMNAFSGDYNQQFDLSEYAKGTIILQVQQGDKLYTEQVIVN